MYTKLQTLFELIDQTNAWPRPLGASNAEQWLIKIKEEADRIRAEPEREVYRLIEGWCAKNFGTGGALGLMRLVLSLYNGRAFSFSIPVCIRDLDEERAELAKAVILDYFERGESEELLSLAQKFSQMIEPFEWSPGMSG